MAKSKFGLVIAPDQKPVRRSEEMRLDTDVDQFKYYQTVLIKRTMPAVTDSPGTNFATITLSYPHGLPYLPAFETFLKGHKGTWGKIIRGAQSVGFGGHAEFPYSGSEYVDTTEYSCSLSVYGGTTTGGIAQHEVTIRLTLLYNEAFV